jgi:hypothetical protein
VPLEVFNAGSTDLTALILCLRQAAMKRRMAKLA